MTGVTRGALYHHFSGKKGLFLAVFEDALDEIADRCKNAARSSTDPWDEFIATTRAFFDACMDPDLQQIVLIDAPATLGWAAWRQIDENKTMAIWWVFLPRVACGVMQVLRNILGRKHASPTIWKGCVMRWLETILMLQ